jgi:hypothetical protein
VARAFDIEARRFISSFGKYARALDPPELLADEKAHDATLARVHRDEEA